jgi:hypothetical protein
VLFLWSIYLLARTISGGDTAWSVLMAASFAPQMVWFGWQARYYSATLAFTALSGLAIWTFTRRGTWRDAVVTGLVLVLLFHTHSLSFLILTGVLLVNAPAGLGHPRWISKLLLTGAIVACGILPWMYWTDYLHAAIRIPAAWPLLQFPSDFVSWFAARKAFVAIIGLIVLLAPLAAVFPRWRFGRRILAAASDKSAFYFTLTWFVIAYLAFMFLIPAASFLSARMMLVLIVPGYLLFSLCVAVAARTMTPRFAVLVSPLIVIAFLGVRGTATIKASRLEGPSGLEPVLDVASRWTLAPGTKLYAWPHDNLILTYYSGLPVQSIAPVRKAFLDKYPGDIILLELGTPYVGLPASEVRTIARQRGVELSPEEARQSSFRIQHYGARQYLQGHVADIWPPPEPARQIDHALLAQYKEQTEQSGEEGATGYPLLRGFSPSLSLSSIWLPVFYRFVDPEKRLGDRLNYRDRMLGATAIVLPNGSIIFDARRNRDVPLVDRARYLALADSTALPGRDSTNPEAPEGRQ